MNDVILERLKVIDERLSRIEAQVMRTNGRVSALEKWRVSLVTAIFVLALVKFPDLKALLGIM